MYAQSPWKDIERLTLSFLWKWGWVVDMQDVVQDIILAYLEKKPDLKKVSLGTWIKRQLHDIIKRRNAQKRNAETIDFDAVEKQVLNDEFCELEIVLEVKMPEHYEIVDLLLKGYSRNEIKNKTGLSYFKQKKMLNEVKNELGY